MSKTNHMLEDGITFVVEDFRTAEYMRHPDGHNYAASFYEPIFSFFMLGEEEYEFPITLAMWLSKFYYYFSFLEEDKNIIILDKHGAIINVLEEVSERINDIKYHILERGYGTQLNQPESYLVAKLIRCMESIDVIMLNLDYFVELLHRKFK